MTDRELIDRLLLLAQTAVDQIPKFGYYDEPEDALIWRELKELKAAVAALAELEAHSLRYQLDRQ